MTWPYVDMAELETRVRRRSDLSTSTTNPQFVTQAELQQYIQKSWEKLYNYLVGKYEDYFIKMATESSVVEYTAGGTGIVASKKDYNFPANYFKLVKIELLQNTSRTGSGNFIRQLKKLNWNQERMYCDPDVRGEPYYYILYGRVDAGEVTADPHKHSGFRLVPTPDVSTYGLDIIYVPRPPEIPTASETESGLSFVAGWDEYVVLDACIKCRDKREEDTRVLQEERADWLRTVEEAIMPRDAGQAHEITAFAEHGPFHDNEELMELYR